MPSELAGPLIGAGIGAASDLAGAAFEAKAIDKAADTQLEIDARARADLQPFRDAGASRLGDLASSAGQGFNLDFERTQGFRDIQNSAAAGGKLHSGGTLAALTEFNSGLNARHNSERFNQLFNLASLGANAAAGQASNSLQTGNNLSSLHLAKGGVYSGATNSLGTRFLDLFGS